MQSEGKRLDDLQKRIGKQKIDEVGDMGGLKKEVRHEEKFGRRNEKGEKNKVKTSEEN